MELFFREMGSGPDLVILHGLFGSSDNWMGIAKELQNDFRVIIPDLPNHGQSPHTDSMKFDGMVMELHDFIENKTDRPHLLGHSLGGKVAMHFALSFGDLIDHLVVADIATKHYPVHHQTILEGLNSIKVESLQSRKEADQALSEYVPEFGVRAFLLKNLARDEEGNFSWKLNLELISERIEDVGDGIHGDSIFSGPTLFMRGEKSKYVSDKDFEDGKKFFPNAKLVTVSNAGHWLHAENPKEFVAKLLEFL